MKKTNQFFILFIIADGKASEENELETIKAIEMASNYSLSIVMIGVGDGPWDTVLKYESKLLDRKFDNFQFVNFHRLMRSNNAKWTINTTNELKFMFKVFMKIPEQYRIVKQLGYI